MRGHVRKRGQRWCVVIDLGRDTATGARKRKWYSGYPTKAAAEDARIELLGKQQRGENIDPDKTPLGAYVTEWLNGRVDELRPLSVTQYASVIRNHIHG